jgi:glucosamine--fructose-6-phosphate aminotransferase (isomerizing)
MKKNPCLQFLKRQADIWQEIHAVLKYDIFWGRHAGSVPQGSVIFFPCHDHLFCCGLAGIVSIKKKEALRPSVDTLELHARVRKIESHTFTDCRNGALNINTHYLGGRNTIDGLLNSVRRFKQVDIFQQIFMNRSVQEDLLALSGRIQDVITGESEILSMQAGSLTTEETDTIFRSVETLKDVFWCLTNELYENIRKTEALITYAPAMNSPFAVKLFRELNAVFNSIDRLEVRGRDSAGITVMMRLARHEFDALLETLAQEGLADVFQARCAEHHLTNQSIRVASENSDGDTGPITLAFTNKIAAEIGSLGDNVSFLRDQIKADAVFQRTVVLSPQSYTISSHTRWASVGAITEANCHPVDNLLETDPAGSAGIIHTCLNGDIDNYMLLKAEIEKSGACIQKDITTDTKIIPLQIQKYLRQGNETAEAFRLALNDFHGSHAISMQTSIAPGKLFLAQKGSGQAIFVGLSEDKYMPASEVYGFVEETSFYLKIDGEKIIQGKQGKAVQGQIFILDQDSDGGISGIQAMYYDGTPIQLNETDIKHTDITSRDIDRQQFPHYFLKEISESPASVEKTIQNRWKIENREKNTCVTVLDQQVLPERLKKALLDNAIRRIFFVGQGTAGVAAQACADILSTYLNDKQLYISALKASELSGSKLNEDDSRDSMADALIIAISQSGTTTDTNRTVDMVKERGASTLAIVNRRDSDITFKVDGVMYTSTGRDIEMSVASTKAFYSQIVAGALLGLHIARLTGRRSAEFVTREITQLLELPGHMRKILGLKEQIQESAQRLAARKSHWAAVGSGPNKASADEIRIKLSELCYKTISSDYVEDKKHIDLSSEPLIIVCAAGAKSTVIGDIIKDTAIFRAHKAAPVVIANEGEKRFDPYAVDVFHVPAVPEHFAPIVNTLVGHIWGYYAALAINEGSRFLHTFREELKDIIDQEAEKGLDVYEVVLEKTFREKIILFYSEFRAKKFSDHFPISIAMASDLTLLLKYLSGRLHLSDFELDFGIKGTAANMLNTLFEYLGESINFMSRPVDAIKHQAKTVTVGTSRISEKIEGILFDALAEFNLHVSQIAAHNVLVLRNLQEIISGIEGAILYKIGSLNLLGEPTDETTIEVIEKQGVLKPIPSRVETDTQLKGTKRIIVRQGNVYIGKGRKDSRSIVVIPGISASPSGPNMIQNLLLLNISFKKESPLPVKIKALGGKYEHIKNIVQENSVPWKNDYLNTLDMEELFGLSAEKIGEFIVSKVS